MTTYFTAKLRGCYKINGRNALAVYYMKIRVLKGILPFTIKI